MKPRMIYAFLLLLFFFLQQAGAQVENFTIKGKVTDENGEPLQGAAVAVLNSPTGTITSFNGSYSLRADTAGVYSLRFSYTGYEPVIRIISVPGTLITDVTLHSRFTRTEEVIVSATRAGTRTPVTFTGITEEDIRKSNPAQDMPYLMGLTPSLVETSEAGTGIGYTSFRIRGTDGSRINITLDGIPLNDAESQQVFWVDLPDLASSVDNIQVQRGVGTSSNGAGAFGASVNMQARNPDNQPFAEINSSTGSFSTFKSTITAGTGLMADKFALQFRYSGLKSDGYIRRTGSDNKAYALSGIYRAGRSILKMNILSGEEHTGISWWGVPVDSLYVNRRYNPAGEYTDENGVKQYYNNESDNYKQTHYQLIYGLSLNDHINVQAALHYTRGDGYYEEFREDQVYSDYGIAPVRIDTIAINSTDLIRRKWMKNDFYGMVWSLNYKKNRIEAVAGGGINYYSGHHFGQILWMQYAGSYPKDYQWYFNKAGKGEFSLYGKMNYRINEQLSAFGDFQFRHISYRMTGPDDDLKDLTQNHFFDFLNPKAGFFLTIKSGQEAYLSFSVAHKEPTRSDFQNASGDVNVTPKPETLFDTEAGYHLKGTSTNLEVNFFGMFYRDQLVPTGQLSNVGYPIMTNVKNSYRAGVEVILDLKPINKIGLRLSSTISRNRIKGFTEYYTEYLSDGSSRYLGKYLGITDIAYSPGIIASGDLAYRISDMLDIHFISKFVGRQYFDNTMSSDRSINPYFVNNLDLGLNVPVRKIKALEFRLNINNIFNNLYESNAYGGFWNEDGVEKTWAYYFPQAGRNFLVSAGIKF